MTTAALRRRRLARALAPAVGLLAAGLLVWQGSYAAFSANTDATNNVWQAGQLVLTNNGGGTTYAATTTAVFGGNPIRPGDTGTTCLTVKSTGNLSGTLKMYLASLADSTPSLGSQILLTVDEAAVSSDVQANCTGFPSTGVTNVATNVSLTSFPTTYTTAGGGVAIAGGTVLEAYRVTWTFQTTGSNANDNNLQGKSVTAAFRWEIQ
ncbi:MAG: hypothetical protein IRZ02_04325 [Acidothermus sp.]|nr:hypothetical protein [Acidothermus sp.]MCL6537240.1 hypothetical protein [Acidothermus sp.]